MRPDGKHRATQCKVVPTPVQLVPNEMGFLPLHAGEKLQVIHPEKMSPEGVGSEK